MSNINKFLVENSVRLSLFRHRGNAVAAAHELGYDLNYVKSIAKKIKTRMQRDVNYHIASSIMEMMLMDYHQRTTCLSECLKQLTGKTEAILSVCCKMPVKLAKEKRYSKKNPKKYKWFEIYKCIKCGKKCEGLLATESRIYNLLFATISHLREEDKNLVEGAVKLGFTGEQSAPVPIVRQQSVVLMDRGITEEEKTVVKQIEQLDPMERQSLRAKLEKEVLKLSGESE